MPPLTHRWFLALDIINRCNDPPPDGPPVEITLVEHGVGLHGGLDSSPFAVLLD